MNDEKLLEAMNKMSLKEIEESTPFIFKAAKIIAAKGGGK